MAWVAVMGACTGTLCLWCRFLEHDPQYGRIRSLFFRMLGTTLTLELVLCWVQSFEMWMVIVLLATYSWGGLDAVLRFPVVHDTNSFFALKQLFLLVFKIACLTYNYRSCAGIRICYFAMLVLNILMLPMIYCLSLPLDSSDSAEELGFKAVLKADLLVHILRIAGSREDREKCMSSCKRQARSFAVGLAQRSEVAAFVVLQQDPGLKNVVHSTRRV